MAIVSGLSKLVLYIGIVYVIQSTICSIYATVKLVQYVQDKNQAEVDSLAIIEDKETSSILATLLSISLCCTITSSLLIWGTIKRNHLFFLPWLYISCSLIVVTGIYLFVIVYTAIWNSIHTKTHPASNMADGSATEIVIFALALTFQIAIYKTIKMLYKELMYEREMRLFKTSSATYLVHELEMEGC